MTLATSGADGPWAAAVFFVNNGFGLYFLSAATTRHCMNLAACPRVVATIQEDYRDWQQIRGVRLEGSVSELHGLEAARALALYAAKFPVVGNLAMASATIVSAMSGVKWYRLAVESLYFIDNSLGFGHRDQVPCVSTRIKKAGYFNSREQSGPTSRLPALQQPANWIVSFYSSLYRCTYFAGRLV